MRIHIADNFAASNIYEDEKKYQKQSLEESVLTIAKYQYIFLV